MALADYIGRQYDVMAFAGVTAVGESLLAQEIFGESAGEGTIAVGTQKLAQRWFLEFMTIKGSMPFKTDRGSRFLEFVRAGRIQSDLDAYSTFSFAQADITANLLRDESPTDPLDERFAGVELLNVVFAPGYLSLRVQVKSRAGDSREVIVPVATTL